MAKVVNTKRVTELKTLGILKSEKTITKQSKGKNGSRRTKVELTPTVQEFHDYLVNNSLSINTAHEYSKDIMEYLKWYQTKIDKSVKDLTILNRQDILKYKNYVRLTLGNVAVTTNRKIASLKSYNEFLIDKGIMDSAVIIKNDFISIQTKYASPTTVTSDEVSKFVGDIKANESKRNYAITMVLMYCGLRISECLGMELEFVDLENQEILVRSGKGDKERIVNMNSKVVSAIKDYIVNERNTKTNGEHVNSPYLFISRQSDKVTTQSVHAWMKKYAKLHPHMLRHFFCSNALEHGYTLAEIMNQAGHSQLQTTMRYTNPTQSEMKKKAELL